jgi:hypothetical protein
MWRHPCGVIHLDSSCRLPCAGIVRSDSHCSESLLRIACESEHALRSRKRSRSAGAVRRHYSLPGLEYPRCGTRNQHEIRWADPADRSPNGLQRRPPHADAALLAEPHWLCTHLRARRASLSKLRATLSHRSVVRQQYEAISCGSRSVGDREFCRWPRLQSARGCNFALQRNVVYMERGAPLVDAFCQRSVTCEDPLD